ncbi:PfkB family carbohydrate kinase [Micromonospora soli]|uniref:PfkB family carbohydrate kinase n=1 Tax=Micromonospora sp. NBRC 110009 TaxID=3061627 RepID=UPI002672C2EE|nr:PfkB family carbohydrate kinase [Micromonospora sp. NBRC 110009]WKT97398.1 PfkB family carbohydrate kinase [Micromonospora sp. NBRC 110009]
MSATATSGPMWACTAILAGEAPAGRPVPADGPRPWVGPSWPPPCVRSAAPRSTTGARSPGRPRGFVEATHRAGLAVLDRVGGGDSFASGLIYGLLKTGDLATAVEYGAAHGALAMTTPGDTSMASLKEVESLVGGGGARVQR